MIIGYSFWGFIGPGITDTPDGGRSHRRPLLEALRAQGHDLILLQRDRDLLEARYALPGHYRFDAGLPALDAVMLEWRWPMPGRNTTACGTPGHTCDLHRQAELLAAYTERQGTATVIWDKDRMLPPDDHLRNHCGVAVCEAALHPTPGAHRLLFPVEDHLLECVDPDALAARNRPVTLAYVGNQYNRDEAFDAYFAPAARQVEHVIAGKWTDTTRWGGLRFIGRVPFVRVRAIHTDSLATVLLLPQRYARVGQVTQRLVEAVLAGCLPLAPASIRGIATFVPRALHVRSGAEVIDKLRWLRALAGTPQHADLIAACLQHLDPFRLSAQIAELQRILHELANATPVEGNAV